MFDRVTWLDASRPGCRVAFNAANVAFSAIKWVCFTLGANWRALCDASISGIWRDKKSASWAPAPNLTVQAVERNETDWTISVTGQDHATCPVCGARSISRHSSYRRTLQDLPAQGMPVTVRAPLTRWRCRNDQCERRIFAERLPRLASPFARRTARQFAPRVKQTHLIREFHFVSFCANWGRYRRFLLEAKASIVRIFLAHILTNDA